MFLLIIVAVVGIALYIPTAVRLDLRDRRES